MDKRTFLKNGVLFFCFLVGVFEASAQEYIFNDYQDYFGHELELKSDFKFRSTFRFDLQSSWTIGTFTIKDDTIYLKRTLVLDTIRYFDPNTNRMADSTIMSQDEKSNVGFDSFDVYQDNKWQRVIAPNLKTQDIFGPPEKLFFRHNKLYLIDKNTTLVKRRHGAVMPVRRRLFGEKKFPMWYKKKHKPNR